MIRATAGTTGDRATHRPPGGVERSARLSGTVIIGPTVRRILVMTIDATMFELQVPITESACGNRILRRKDRQILFITGFLSKRWGNKRQGTRAMVPGPRVGILLFRLSRLG